MSATQIPSSEIDASWHIYTRAEVGYSIQYPADWQAQDLPDETDGQQQHITLQGREGGVELIWGFGLGGACPDGYQPIGDTDFTGFVYTKDTTAESRDVVVQVLSTLSFQ